jgi:hypothetical protein
MKPKKITITGYPEFEIDVLQESINQIAMSQEEYENRKLLSIVKEHAIPKIKDEVTIGKLKWRGIYIKQSNQAGKIVKEVWQRDKKIGEIFFAFDLTYYPI